MTGERVPPPPGLSAESHIHIDRDGHFWHDGHRVTHEGLLQMLPKWLDFDEKSGRYVLENAINWGFITVEDTPFVVRAISRGDGDTILVHLSDGSTEPLVTPSLRIDADDVPYCDVKGGRFPARFGREAAYDLLQDAHVERGQVSIQVGGQAVALLRVGRGQGKKPPRNGP